MVPQYHGQVSDIAEISLSIPEHSLNQFDSIERALESLYLVQSQKSPSVKGSRVTNALDGIELIIVDFNVVIADREVLSRNTLNDAPADCGLQTPLAQACSEFLSLWRNISTSSLA